MKFGKGKEDIYITFIYIHYGKQAIVMYGWILLLQSVGGFIYKL